MSDHQYAVLCSAAVFLVMVLVVAYLLYKFLESDAWKYINTSKQKTWQPDFLLKGEELRVVRTPYSYPESSLMVTDYGYGHDVVSSNENVIIYWRESDYFKAKRLYEDQILAES